MQNSIGVKKKKTILPKSHLLASHCICFVCFLRDTFILCLVNGGSSFVAGFAIFSVLGFMSYEQGLPISEVAASGESTTTLQYVHVISFGKAPNINNDMERVESIAVACKLAEQHVVWFYQGFSTFCNLRPTSDGSHIYSVLLSK